MRAVIALALCAGLASPAGAAWQTDVHPARMSGAANAYVWIRATDQATAWPNERFYPELHVQCSERRLMVVFQTPRTAFNVEPGNLDGATLRFRFDDEPAFRRSWQQTTDGHAAGSYDAGFVRRFSKAKRLLVEWIPFQSKPQVVQFDLSGFADAKKPLEDGCKVKL